MTNDNLIIMILLGITNILIYVVVWMLATNPQDLSGLQDNTKRVAVSAGIGGLAVILLAIASYFFFAAETAYVSSFLHVMMFVSLFVAILSMCISYMSVTLAN